MTSGLDTVAVRSPAHPVATALLRAVDVPIAAPSANRFGHVSPTNAAHVLDDLDGRCDLVLDAGDTVLGLESTVVRVELDHVVLLRHGALAVEELDVPVREGSVRPSSSPGLAVRHYSPETEMFVIEPNGGTLPEAGGVYLGYHDSGATLPEGWRLEVLGDRSDLGVVGARLYRLLRRIDAARPGMIVAELTGKGGLGRAIDDRLIRAASGRIL